MSAFLVDINLIHLNRYSSIKLIKHRFCTYNLNLGLFIKGGIVNILKLI